MSSVNCVSLAISKEESLDGDIPVLHFKRGKRETEKAYVRRMENETKHILFLTKNQVDRKPELDADKQERPADKGKSEKKKEWVDNVSSITPFCSFVMSKIQADLMFHVSSFLSCHRYDAFKLQRLQQKKLDRQEAIMEKEMFVGKETFFFPQGTFFITKERATLTYKPVQTSFWGIILDYLSILVHDFAVTMFFVL